MKAATADILIPAYHPGAEMEELLKRLKKQTYPIERIYIINTDEKGWNPRWQEIDSRILVTHISKKEFDHGGTRKMAAEKSEADYMIFMTQDAMPADTRLVEHLIKAFEQPGVKAAYARQLPREDCRLVVFPGKTAALQSDIPVLLIIRQKASAKGRKIFPVWESRPTSAPMSVPLMRRRPIRSWADLLTERFLMKT